LSGLTSRVDRCLARAAEVRLENRRHHLRRRRYRPGCDSLQVAGWAEGRVSSCVVETVECPTGTVRTTHTTHTTHDTTVVRARCWSDERHESSSPGYLESELGGEHAERDAMGDGHVGRDVHRRHLWKMAACSGETVM
jgi:hypothetical protein